MNLWRKSEARETYFVLRGSDCLIFYCVKHTFSLRSQCHRHVYDLFIYHDPTLLQNGRYYSMHLSVCQNMQPPWLISFVWACSSCKEMQWRHTKWKTKWIILVGFEPGTFRLRSRRAIECATRFDIPNRLKINRVIHVLYVEKCFVVYNNLPTLKYSHQASILVKLQHDTNVILKYNKEQNILDFFLFIYLLFLLEWFKLLYLYLCTHLVVMYLKMHSFIKETQTA